MNELERDNPDGVSRPVQTARRLNDASRERAAVRSSAPAKPARLREDPMMSDKVRPRRKRCRHCRYRFDYRMHTNRCPECGRYRDDYPHPNHGLQAMLFAGAVVGGICAVILVVVIMSHI